jgi:hypothetical protein
MGFQQSIVKLKENKFMDFIFFIQEETEWMKTRGLRPNCCVRVAADIDILKSKYKKDEICVVIEGERHYQRKSEPDGLWGLDLVESVVFIDNLSAEILDNYFPRIKDDLFYKQFQAEKEEK